ncbi:hypothetical protein [Profundibacter sp.]
MASRDTGWANKLTQMLAKISNTPSQVSIASMGAAATALRRSNRMVKLIQPKA